MAKTTLPAHQERSRKTLNRLLRAAAEILDREGLEAATIPRIAARAGVTPGAVYRRFPDKDALMREVCLRILQENYEQNQELLSRENWHGKSLAEMTRSLIELILKGHALRRGLLRAIAFFTYQHHDAEFLRKSEKWQHKMLRAVSDLLLTRRSEIRHPHPEAAVPFALIMIGMVAKGALVLPRNPNSLSQILPEMKVQLEVELPRMVFRYLGIDE